MINQTSYRSQTVCTAVTGSMTVALKAQRVLGKNALRAEVIKVSSSPSNRGCIYGLQFDCVLLENVKSTLHNAGINVKEYLR